MARSSLESAAKRYMRIETTLWRLPQHTSGSTGPGASSIYLVLVPKHESHRVRHLAVSLRRMKVLLLTDAAELRDLAPILMISDATAVWVDYRPQAGGAAC